MPDPPAAPLEVLVSQRWSWRNAPLLPGHGARLHLAPTPTCPFSPPLLSPSQQQCLRTCGQAGTRPWIRAKTNPSKTASDARRQHPKGAGSPGGERQSSPSAAPPARAKWKWWQPQTDLPHHGLSPTIPQINFVHDKPFHCLFPYPDPGMGLEGYHGNNF